MMTPKLRQNSRAQRFGFTTLEMLLAMAVLGLILAIAAALLQTNQRASDAQQARTNSLEDARMAASRMAESINQAAYIYPAGKQIRITSGIGLGGINGVTTGTDALALLVPDGLNSTPRRYHGVVFYLADRQKFLADLPNLPSNRIAPWVLVEARTGLDGAGAIGWPLDELPILDWDAVINEGVLVDGMLNDVANPDPRTNSNLMRDASFSPSAGVDKTVFNKGLRVNNSGMAAADALLLGVSFQLSIRVSAVGQAGSTTPSALIPGLGTARNVPRR
jgi:prepilin-type N-terminal cleavage/methylation domain-containing protein